MQNKNSELHHDDVDLIKFTKKIVDSKILILTSAFFCLMLAFVYILFSTPTIKSSALIELGRYEFPNGEEMPIEDAKIFIEKLNLKFVYDNSSSKKEIQTTFTLKNDELIEIEIHSKSIKQNISRINEIISYSKERHSSKSKQHLLEKIKLLNSQINSLISLTNSPQLTLSKIENSSDESIDTFNFINQKSAWEHELQLNSNTTVTESQLIGTINSNNAGPGIPLILFLAALIGIISGILIVFLIDFKKAYRQEFSQ